MKVLAFAASNSRQSINKQLVGYAASLLPEGTEVELIDLNDFEMPIFSIDREQESGTPTSAQTFYDKIGAADAVLMSFAEHNASYTAVYKNLFDWTSRINAKVYQNKPVVMLATSPGLGGASNVLGAAINSAPYFGIDLKGSLSVPSFYDHFDAVKGALSNEDINAQLQTAIAGLLPIAVAE